MARNEYSCVPGDNLSRKNVTLSGVVSTRGHVGNQKKLANPNRDLLPLDVKKLRKKGRGQTAVLPNSSRFRSMGSRPPGSRTRTVVS